MGTTRKASTLVFLLVLVASSLCVVNTVFAQSIPKPSVPEFTIELVDSSYSVTTTDPYTGLSETQIVSNCSIQITIRNQNLGDSGNQIYYNVRAKPTFGADWVEAYPLQNRSSSPMNDDGTFTPALYLDDNTPQAKYNSGFTTLVFPIEESEVYGSLEHVYYIQKCYHYELDEQSYHAFISAVPAGGKIDFQVEAISGHDSTYWYVQHPLYPQYGGLYMSAIAYDSTSGWSNTQTIRISDGAVSSSSANPTESPTSNPMLDATPTAIPKEPYSANDLISTPLSTVIALVAVFLGIVVALLVVFLVLMHSRIRVLERKQNGAE